MTSGQRKAHRIIWILLVIIIPVLLFLAIKDLNFQAPEKKANTIEKSSDKAIIYTKENEIIKVNLLEGELQIILKSSLKNASSIVHIIDKKGKHLGSLGQISTPGIYSFNISNRIDGIALNDAIKDKEITKLFFQWQ